MDLIIWNELYTQQMTHYGSYNSRNASRSSNFYRSKTVSWSEKR